MAQLVAHLTFNQRGPYGVTGSSPVGRTIMNNKKEYIVCAAWMRKEPRKIDAYSHSTNEIAKIEIGYRHHDIYQRFGDELSLEDGAMGFYTSRGRFVGRVEAMKIAYEAGQVSERRAIYSDEDIKIYEKIGLLGSGVKVGDFKPLASEDLYCCSESGDPLKE